MGLYLHLGKLDLYPGIDLKLSVFSMEKDVSFYLNKCETQPTKDDLYQFSLFIWPGGS